MRVWLYSREDVLSIPFFLLFLLAFSSGDGATLQLEMPDDNYPGLKVGLILVSPLFFHAHNLWSKFYQTNRATRIYSLRIFFTNGQELTLLINSHLFFVFLLFFLLLVTRFAILCREISRRQSRVGLLTTHNQWFCFFHHINYLLWFEFNIMRFRSNPNHCALFLFRHHTPFF